MNGTKRKIVLVSPDALAVGGSRDGDTPIVERGVIALRGLLVLRVLSVMLEDVEFSAFFRGPERA